MERIAVTGATGKVGRALVPRLVERELPLRLAVRPSSDPPPEAPDAEVIDFDLDRVETHAPFFAGVRRVFFSTPVSPDMAERVTRVAQAMDDAGVEHVVRLSTRGADPATETRLPRWHGEAEEVLAAARFGVTVIRPNAFMQNYLGLAPRIREDGTIYRNERDARLSLIDVRDVAAVAAVILAEDSPRDVVLNPTGPEALSNDDVARALTEATGRVVRYVNTDDDAARLGMIGGGMPEWLADVMVEFHVRRQGPGFDDITSDVEAVTGSRPRTFAAFAAEHATAFVS